MRPAADARRCRNENREAIASTVSVALMEYRFAVTTIRMTASVMCRECFKLSITRSIYYSFDHRYVSWFISKETVFRALLYGVFQGRFKAARNVYLAKSEI